MNYKINRTFNGMTVMIDDKKQLSLLAEWLNRQPFSVVEIRYHFAADTGVIILSYDGVYATELSDELAKRINTYIKGITDKGG